MTSISSDRGETRLSLPWPNRNLSPNARCHWGVKANAVKDARNTARVLTLQALKMRRPHWEAVAIHWEFHPKTANKPDDDNIIASCKAYRDGIADALGIDDAKFTTTHSMGQPVKGGAVNVTVRSA